MGLWVGRPSLTIVSDLEGESTVPGLSYATIRSEKEVDSIRADVKGSKLY